MQYALALLAALLAPLLFPATVSFLVVLVAAYVFPPVALLAGVVTDALYRTSFSLPYASILGLVVMGLMYAVHWFLRTRIMG